MYSNPLAKIIYTPRNAYFYDANRNELVMVDQESGKYLEDIINGKSDYVVPEKVQELYKYGFLNSEGPEIIEHFATERLALLLERRIKKLTLQITQDCNFRCKYCIYTLGGKINHRAHSLKKMSWSTAKKAIDFAVRHSIDFTTINIGFYGGEPLTEFELIKKCVEYAEEFYYDKHFTYTITTNGSIITDEILCFFKQYNFAVVISIDGPEKINDSNRVFANGRGTFKTVIDNLKFIREKYPEMLKQIQISMVLNPIMGFDAISEISFRELGIMYSQLVVAMVDVGRGKTPAEFSSEFISEYNYSEFLSFLAYYKIIKEIDVSEVSNSIMGEFIAMVEHQRAYTSGIKRIAAPSGPCVPGKSRLFVTADGKLFPCERVSEESKVMQIGTLEDGFDIDRANKILNIAQITENECKNCWAFRMCKICARAADAIDHLSPQNKRELCGDVKATAVKQLRTEAMMRELHYLYNDSFEYRKL